MEMASTFLDIFLNFKSVFTKPTGKVFLRLVTGWILCPQRRTITGILPFADPEEIRQHDTYHRFFKAASWSVEALFKVWTAVLLKAVCKCQFIHLQTDDTVIKKTGRKVKNANYHRDAVRSSKKNVCYVWGLKIVPVCLRVIPPWGGEPLSLPVNLRIYKKGGPTLIVLVEDMMLQLINWFPKYDFILVADGFYASLAGKDLPRTQIISRMRHDGAIYELPVKKKHPGRGRPRKKGKRLPAPAKMAKRVTKWKMVETCERGKTKKRLVYTRIVLWYKVNPNKPVLLVISRDPEGKEKDDFFFTTDTAMSPTEVINEYANRWAIEDTFKNLKQYLGAEEPQCWKDKGPKRAIAMACILYGSVWLWYIDHGYTPDSLEVPPWYKKKSTPSFIDAISSLRINLWRKRFFATSYKNADLYKFCDSLINAISKAA